MEHHTFPGSRIPAAYGPYSHAVVAGDFVFLAGQTARDPDTGKLIDGDITAQTTRALEIVRDVLAEFGLTLGDIVRSVVYLADISDFDAMNRVYSVMVPSPFPARSTPEARLPFGAKVSIEVTAYRGRVNQAR